MCLCLACGLYLYGGRGRGNPYFVKVGGRVWCTPTSNIEFPKGVKIDNYTLSNNPNFIKDVKSLKTNNLKKLKDVKIRI